MPTTAVKRNAVRRCTVLAADGTDSEIRTVYCPRRERAEAFERCCGCAHMLSVDVADDGEHGTVDCSVPGVATDRLDKKKRAEPSVQEAAGHTRLMDAMSDDVACVRADVRLADAAKLMVARGVRALPVVDDARRLVGMLSKSDLVRAGVQGVTGHVSDVMTPLVHGLPEEAPLALAISLMARERLHEVPAVAADGRVVGMLTAVDALGWMAARLGYLVPKS